MPRSKHVKLGRILRKRRRQLGLTQRELAGRIKTSAGYITLLESGDRHPSPEVMDHLANALGLDGRELFFLLHPSAGAILNPALDPPVPSAWEQFKNDRQLQRLHSISRDEMEMLSRVALLGEVGSPREFLYVLNAVRWAVSR